VKGRCRRGDVEGKGVGVLCRRCSCTGAQEHSAAALESKFEGSSD